MVALQDTDPSIAAWFSLRDSARTTFELLPERDAKVWCGEPRDQERLRRALEDGLAAGVPHLILLGEYGTGKTHALRHTEWLLQSDTFSSHKAFAKRSEWSGFSARTRFVDVYRETLHRLGSGLIADLLRESLAELQKSALPDPLHRLLLDDQDLKMVLSALATVAQNKAGTEKIGHAWRWLLGLSLTQAQRRLIGVTTLLTETRSAATLVDVLRIIGAAYQIARGGKLLLLYDETEQANELRRSRDAINSFNAAMRALYDREQRELGIVMAIYSTGGSLDDIPIFQADVRSRIDHSRDVLNFVPLVKPEQRRDFLDRVLQYLVRDGLPLHHPFAGEAPKAFFLEHCQALIAALRSEMRNTLTRRGEITQRTVMMALESVTRMAYNLRVPAITIELMQNNYPSLR